jgi:4-amino-4-deoxy-L-arabinose transferase-like glycosyltransferase
VALAIIGQSALLRTYAPIPAVPVFLLAVLVAGWVAARHLSLPASPNLGFFPSQPSWRWAAALALTVGLSLAALWQFDHAQGSAGWLIFAGSVLMVGVACWMIDGCPKPCADWRREMPWLFAVGVLTVCAAVLRFSELGSVPYGLWFDEAYSGLQVQHILSDPSFRPVYMGGLAQEPSLLWYVMLPTVKLLGPTLLALRLPTAVGGILGIPAMYLLGRELFGRKTGLIAAALLATLAWHLTFSRIAFNSEWSVTLDALGLFLMVRSFRKGSWTAAGLAGVCLGLGLHMYYTSRLMVVIGALAVVLLWLPHPRRYFGSAWRVAAAVAFAGLITALPLVDFARQHPDEFNNRLQQASVMNEIRDQHSVKPLIENLKAHALMFNLGGDRNARHNMPGEPELNFLLGGMFVLGLGMSVARLRRPEFALLPVWAVLMLAGGVFSVSFEAPQSLRTIDEINVVVLLAALPLALLWDAAGAMLHDPHMFDDGQETALSVPR